MVDGAISRDEILSGGLARQRRARLVVQRLLACREDPAQAADPALKSRAELAPGPEDSLAVQLRELRTRSTRRQVLDGRLLLEQRARWQSLIPADPALRAEVRRQLGQAVSCSADQGAELDRLFAPGAGAG